MLQYFFYGSDLLLGWEDSCLRPDRAGIIPNNIAAIIFLKYHGLLNFSKVVMSLSKGVMTYCRVLCGLPLGCHESVEYCGICCGYHEPC